VSARHHRWELFALILAEFVEELRPPFLEPAVGMGVVANAVSDEMLIELVAESARVAHDSSTAPFGFFNVILDAIAPSSTDDRYSSPCNAQEIHASHPKAGLPSGFHSSGFDLRLISYRAPGVAP